MTEARQTLCTPLDRLAGSSGREFPNLSSARALTADALRQRREKLALLGHTTGVAIVLMGSWGRLEITSGSDDDFLLLSTCEPDCELKPTIDDIKGVLDRAPGDQGIFGAPVHSRRMIQKIGLEDDANSNLTQRILFLLESEWATEKAIHDQVRDELLARYLDESIKDHRPPRFLLNDLIRYWRTICVDFAAKELEAPRKWGLRNAKLRTSRKMLFAGGLLPVFECAGLQRSAMFGYLKHKLAMPPTDRLAEAFLLHDAADAGGRTLGAYDDFIGLLDDSGFRRELEGVTRGNASRSEAFREAKRLGHELEQGLLALLFETHRLPGLVRSHAIF